MGSTYLLNSMLDRETILEAAAETGIAPAFIEKDDPTIIRHLHDLAALKKIIFEHKEIFTKCAGESLLSDQGTRGGNVIADMGIHERLIKSLDVLSIDKKYRSEYQQFVQNMSYADEDEHITFDDAMSVLEKVIKLI